MTDAISTLTSMSVDPGSGTFGAWTSYAATLPITLPSGDGTKTVRAQYRDAAGNTLTRTATIFLDTAAPTTTRASTRRDATYTANQPVTLTAADTGSGVAATYYQIDGGASSTGTTFTVSGDATHTFSWYSVDNANNTETTHTSNTFRIDTTPPVTTSNAQASYNGTATISLTATDIGRLRRQGDLLQGGRRRETTGTVITFTPPSIRRHDAHDPVLVGGQREQHGDADEQRDVHGRGLRRDRAR